MGDTPRPFKKMAGRVEVHYFPKRPARRRGTTEVQVETRAFTLPEFALTPDESPRVTPSATQAVDEAEVETDSGEPVSPPARKKKSGGRKHSGSHRRRTTTELPQVEAEAPAPKISELLKARSPLEVLRTLSRRQVTEVAVEGHQLFERGDLENARRLFEALVALEPSESFTYTMLGTIYLAMGEQDRALALFEAALGVDRTDLAARVYRGELRLHRNRYKLAIDDLQRAIDGGEAGDPFVDRAKRLMKIARQGLSAQQRKK